MECHDIFQGKINKDKIKEAYDTIGRFITKTPIHTSSTIDHLSGKNVYFKCEHFQKTGSFKVRGALNGVLNKISNASCKGFITHSSGNHGAAVAWACKNNNVPCTIVLPADTPKVKVASILSYGAKIAYCESNPNSRVNVCNAIARDENLEIISPYDDYDVMCGQGTVALELLDQVPHLDAILVSVSGGGLISGISVYAKALNPNIRVFAVEPTGKCLGDCIRSSNRNPENKQPEYLHTKAEGIRTKMCGALTFPIINKLISYDDVFTISDEEMIAATKFTFERMKMVVELSAGAAVAAVMSEKMRTKYPELKHVGVILCGGNIDIERLPW